jgi:cysteine-rich repeat protein
LPNCTFVCGNGHLEFPEECDPPDGSTCSANCTNITLPFCGDGVVNQPSEECEPPNTPTCSANCTNITLGPALCGNCILDPGEECDDGNLLTGDGCSSTCQLEPCVCLPTWANGIGSINISQVTSTASLSTFERPLDPWMQCQGIFTEIVPFTFSKITEVERCNARITLIMDRSTVRHLYLGCHILIPGTSRTNSPNPIGWHVDVHSKPLDARLHVVMVSWTLIS